LEDNLNIRRHPEFHGAPERGVSARRQIGQDDVGVFAITVEENRLAVRGDVEAARAESARTS